MNLPTLLHPVETDSRLTPFDCHFIESLMMATAWVVANLVRFFKAALSKATRSQFHVGIQQLSVNWPSNKSSTCKEVKSLANLCCLKIWKRHISHFELPDKDDLAHPAVSFRSAGKISCWLLINLWVTRLLETFWRKWVHRVSQT